MLDTTAIEQDVILVKNLIELNGLSISKAAEVMNIQRTNLSSWLNGKPNVFSMKKIEVMLAALGLNIMSDPSTGIRLCSISPDIVHLWQIPKDAQSLIEVLRSTEDEESLKWMEIIQVDASPKGHFNILRRKSNSGDLIILVASKDSTSRTYPISSEDLGFGKMAGKIQIPLEKWIAWWRTKSLSTAHLRNELESLTRTEQIIAPIDNELNKRELENTVGKLIEAQCSNEGLKAIIRALLEELRKNDPENRLLIKENRDEIYKEYYESEAKKQL